MRLNRRYLPIVLMTLTLLATACDPAPTPVPTEPATQRPTLAPTAEPTLTPTPVVLSDDEKQATFTAYKTMLLGELSARVTLETADRLLSGEDAGMAPFGWIIAGAATAKAADDELKKLTAPELLAPFYSESLDASAQTLDVYGRWLDDKLSVSEVQAEMAPIVARQQAAVESAADALSSVYGWDADALAQTRQDLIDRIPEFFLTGTPTPAP